MARSKKSICPLTSGGSFPAGDVGLEGMVISWNNDGIERGFETKHYGYTSGFELNLDNQNRWCGSNMKWK